MTRASLLVLSLSVMTLAMNGCQCGGEGPNPDSGVPSLKTDGGGDGGESVGEDAGEQVTDGGICNPAGVECASGAECCTGLCNADPEGTFRCAVGAVCEATGAACELAADCCSFNCVGGVCTEGLCAQTDEACSEGDPGACCTGNCASGACAQPAGSSCTVAGDPCTAVGSSSSCCSKSCVDVDSSAATDLRCASVGACRSQGEPCSVPDDCCSYTCGANGVCEDPPVGGSCLVAGSACQSLSDCCSGVCADNGSGFAVCQFLGGCRPEEELCRRETDCCAFGSSSKGATPVCTFYGDAGVGRCRTLSGDAPAGEVCEGSRGNTCAPDNSYCVESSAGINRCAGQCDGGICDVDNCLPAGETCAASDQCCDRICAPLQDGGFACAAECLPVQSACTTSADCCSGTCSLEGFCEAGGAADGGALCQPISASCTDSAQCCSSFCDTSTGTCQVGIQ